MDNEVKPSMGKTVKHLLRAHVCMKSDVIWIEHQLNLQVALNVFV